MRPLLPRRFAAVVSPQELHVLEYRRTARQLQPLRAVQLAGPFPGPAAAAARLAEWVEGESGPGARVAVALSGFDTSVHLLTLPPAPDEVLRAVVGRELARYVPLLFGPGKQPRVHFVRTGEEEEMGTRRQRLLAGVAPAEVVEAVEREISARGLALEHLTLLPAAVQRVYSTFGAGTEPSALVLLLEAPFVGFFHEGEMRLMFEPPAVGAEWAGFRGEQILEQLERGGLFLRQEFRGTTLKRVLLAAPAPEREALAAQIAAAMPVEVELLDPVEQGAPGAAAALGAALDAALPGGLSLLPDTGRAPGGDSTVRALTVATVAVLLLATVWWSWSAVRTAEAARTEIVVLERELAERSERYRAIQPVVEARRAHAQRGAVVDALNREMLRLPELLMALRPNGISVDTFRFSRSEDKWEGALIAVSRAPTSAYAATRVDEYYRRVTTQLPGSTVTLTRLAARPPASGAKPKEGEPDTTGVAIAFEMAVSIPVAPDE